MMHATTRDHVAQRLEDLATRSLRDGLVERAAYFARQLLGLVKARGDAPPLYPTYLLAQCYMRTNETARAKHLLSSVDADAWQSESDLLSRVMLARAECCLHLRDYAACEPILAQVRALGHGTAPAILSALLTVCGDAYDALELSARAVAAYREALRADPACAQAWLRLRARGLLSAPGRAEVLGEIAGRGDDEEGALLAALYEGGALAQAGGPRAPPSSADALLASALAHLSSGAAAWALRATQRILRDDPHCREAIPAHLAALVQLRATSELYVFARNLVTEAPRQALSWYAVGCYYHAMGSYANARRYFGKATSIAPTCAASWLAYGHAAAASGEHDQAVASYRTVVRLAPNAHEPYLAIASELLRAQNPGAAREFAERATEMDPGDPDTFNELGVIDYAQGQYEGAAESFRRAISVHDRVLDRGSDTAGYPARPLLHRGLSVALTNLGHCRRKLGDYADARANYLRAATLLGGCSASHHLLAAVAYTYHLEGDLRAAIEGYHRALASKPQQRFSNHMLQMALQEYAVEAQKGVGGWCLEAGE